MTPEELEKFVNGGPTSVVETMPEIGFRAAERPAARAFATENKVAIFTGAEGDPSVYVYSAATKLSDSVVSLQVVRPFPAPQVILSKVNATAPNYHVIADEIDDFAAEIDGKWDTLRERAVAAMDAIQVWEEPPRTVAVYYMDWFDFDGSTTKMVPRPKGIVAVSEDGARLVGITFPGFEDDARRWSHYKGLPAKPIDALNAVSDMAGRSTMLSNPKEMNGYSWEDATTRALYAYGEFIYADTHRSAFQ